MEEDCTEQKGEDYKCGQGTLQGKGYDWSEFRRLISVVRQRKWQNIRVKKSQKHTGKSNDIFHSNSVFKQSTSYTHTQTSDF